MISDELKKIIDSDDSGLLDLPEKPTAMTEEQRLINSFLEIVEFYDAHGKAPQSATGNMLERRLFSRLNGFRSSPDKIEKLKDFDKYGLLTPVEQPKSIEDILDDDLISDGEGSEILKLTHVPKTKSVSEYWAKRKPAKDFDQYEELFLQCHKLLREGKSKLAKFTVEEQVKPGEFYVLKGVLLYVADIESLYEAAVPANPRLRLIFENGTESDMLRRSLISMLYRDGRRVVSFEDDLFNSASTLKDEDEESGYIYVLKTKSDDEDLARIKNLHKIGFSTQSVEQRIKNAEKDPTYLMSPVEVVASYRCYNMNPQKFERLLHRFFQESRLDIEVTDKRLEKNLPGEWFSVPLGVIDQVVTLIANGEIVHYVYDQKEAKLVLRHDE